MSDTPARFDRPTERHLITPSFRTVRRAAVVSLFGTAIALAACSSSGTTTSSSTHVGTGSPGGVGQAITIKNFAFSPSHLTVAPGASVTVTNDDGVVHTLTSQSGGFDTGNIQAGQSKTFTAPNKAGSYPYICTIHQYMTGTLTVS
ncbi:MAG TPA: cupredoxin domain-containing protein [Acidimicrobiales bacterium]